MYALTNLVVMIMSIILIWEGMGAFLDLGPELFLRQFNYFPKKFTTTLSLPTTTYYYIYTISTTATPYYLTITIDRYNPMSISTTTSTEERALQLLGDSVPPSIVAQSLGVTEGRISQLLSDAGFAAQVSELRYTKAVAHTARDSSYDDLEDTLLERMKDLLPMMHRPMEVLKAIQVINAAKRRSQSISNPLNEKSNLINLVIPIQVVNRFSTNMQGQVITVDDRELRTIQSGNMDSLVRERSQSENAKLIGTSGSG